VDEMSRACNMNGGELHIGFWWDSQKERDRWEDLDVCEMIILRWILVR
jgi:hypothetical protein